MPVLFVETPEVNDRLYVEHLNAKILRSRKVLKDKKMKRRKNHTPRLKYYLEKGKEHVRVQVWQDPEE